MNPKFARLSTLATLVAFAARLNGAVTEGLLGHWTFDETTGATAKDASGNGHDGSVSNFSGDAPPWTTGQIGGGLGFRGPENGDAVIVPAFPEITNTFTISAWVWADGRDGTWPESAIVHSAGATGAGPLGLLIRPKNRDQAFGPLGHTTLAAGGIVAVSEAIGFPVAGWQQVGVVADGSKIHLYRNGVEVGSADYAPPLSPPPSPELGLGVSPDDGGAPGGAFWFGKLDDIGIWQRALTAGQMAAIFNAGQAGKDLTQADAYENVPPTITTQPLSITRFVGEVASFSVAAAGTGTLSYQWKRDGNPIAGATNATYSIGSVKSLDAGEYIVTVTNAGGTKDSQPARLTVQTVTVSTGLIGYWKFDESQGEVASDASGNNNNATLYNYTGDNSQWVAGQVGGALSFGGADAMQYLLVPDYPKPASTLTVSAWVWAETIGAWTSFVKNWGSSDAGQFHFGLAGDGVHENIYIKQVDGKTPNTSDRQPFPTNSWQHVAFVCDGSNVRLYRNGVEVASTTYNGTLVTPPMNCVGVGVKMANDCVDPDGGNPGWLHGKMDDLAIWNRGLSPSEMVAVYQAGLGGKGVLEASTSAVFPPTFSSVLTNLSVFEGVPLTLNGEATGTPPLIYQWFKDGQPIQNATNSSLILGPATLAMAGKYKASVSNEASSITSSDITVTINQRPAAALVSEWKFEGNLNDTSGHNNHGTAAGGVEYVAGVSGSAVRLAAGNPIVNDAAQGLPSGGADSWSINLWLRLASAPTSLAYLAGFGPVNDTGAGTARGLIAYGGTQNNSVSVWGSNADTISSTPYPLNRWAMVTITYDGADGTTSLYLDGQLIAQNVQRRVLIPDGEFHVSLAPTSYWHIDTAGDFDEFTIWSGVLGPSQISALNNVARPKLDVKLAGTTLTLSWPAAATGFVLETTDDMGQGVWNVVPGVTGNTVNLPLGSSRAFYRLKR